MPILKPFVFTFHCVNMLVFDGVISTLQSSLQTVYGLFVGPLTVLNDLKNGKRVITSLSLQERDTIDSLTPPSSHCQDQPTDEKELKSTPIKRSRVIKMMIKDGLACWHFLATLAHLIKRAVAVKIHIVQPDKIVLNQRRVINLSSKLHETMFKHS